MVAKSVEITQAEPNTELLCVATYLPLRRYRDIIPFMRMTFRIEKQLKGSPGLVRYGLRTDIPKKRFWTFSVWKDKASANSFVREQPHHQAVELFARWAGKGAAFVEWSSAEAPIDWGKAMERLRIPMFYYKPPGK